MILSKCRDIVVNSLQFVLCVWTISWVFCPKILYKTWRRYTTVHYRCVCVCVLSWFNMVVVGVVVVVGERRPPITTIQLPPWQPIKEVVRGVLLSLYVPYSEFFTSLLYKSYRYVCFAHPDILITFQPFVWLTFSLLP